MIKLRGISKRFTTKNDVEHALLGVDMDVEENTIHGVIGPSGAGKSTLIRIINQLEAHDEGTLDIMEYKDVRQANKESTRMLRTKIGMIFQSFNLLENKTVYRNVLFPITLFRTPTKNDRAYALELLQTVGLSDYMNRYPAELSGGQRQRVGIARSLINRPKILLCDEPTSALDQSSVKQILSLLKKIQQEQSLTIVFVSHDMHVIKELCDTVTILDKGEAVEKGTINDILLRPKSEATKLLTETVGYNIDKILTDYHIDHTLYLLRFNQKAKENPLISKLSETYHVHMNILYANVTPTHEGVLLIDILGENKDMVLKDLHEKGVEVTHVN
jgi:D-methionine transport system ATP-binding protein